MTPGKETNQITITILGTGTCVPSLDRSSCAVLIEIREEKLLLDAGPGTMRRLLENGTSIMDISHIFLSHFHPDHSGELVSFIFASKYAGLPVRKTPLTLVAGMGFESFFEKLKGAYGRWITMDPENLKIHELDNTAGDCFKSENFSVESLPMQHNDESIGYRIKSPRGTTVVYTGDTDVCDNLVTLAREADLMICESSFPDEMKKSGHLTPSQAGEIAERASVKCLMLTHFYPECDDADIEKQCRKTYNGHLILAEDLVKIVG